MKLTYEIMEYNYKVRRDYYISFKNYRVPMYLPLYPIVLVILQDYIQLDLYWQYPQLQDIEVKNKIITLLNELKFEFDRDLTQGEGVRYILDIQCLEDEHTFFQLFYKILKEIFEEE